MSSAPPMKGGQGAAPMSRERSAESISSNQSLGSNPAGTSWFSSPGQNVASSIVGSLFGAAGSARMRTRTESPLFETEEDDQESRETEELLASEATRQPSPPTSSMGLLSSSLPTNGGGGLLPPRMSRNHSVDGEILRLPKMKSSRRRGSKASTKLRPSTSDDSLKSRGAMEPHHQIEQELQPVRTPQEDRDIIDMYPSTDEDESRINSSTTTTRPEQDSDIPPPLPPRPTAPEPVLEELETIPESVKMQPEFVVQNRKS